MRGRDALPRDPWQDIQWSTAGAAPLIVYAFRRVRRRTSTNAFQTCDAGRAGVQLPSEAGTTDMTIKRADADRAERVPTARSAPNAELRTPNADRLLPALRITDDAQKKHRRRINHHRPMLNRAIEEKAVTGA